MPKRYCIHCGRQIKDKDKFCIYCGKPVVSRGGKGERAADGKVPNLEANAPRDPSRRPGVAEQGAPSRNPGAEKVPDAGREGANAGTEQETDEKGTKDEQEGKGKKKDKHKRKAKKDNAQKDTGQGDEGEDEGKKEDKKPSLEPLEPEIREQLEISCELERLKQKKANLADKLKPIQKLLKDDRYDWDEDYKDEVDIKVQAFKQVKAEYDAQEEALRARKDADFPLVALPPRIEKLKEQIKDLKTQTKFGRIKRDIYDELKQEYVDKLERARDRLSRLVLQVNLYLSRQEAQVSLLKKELRRLKARVSIKEIKRQEMRDEADELKRRIKHLKQDLDTIKGLLKGAKI